MKTWRILFALACLAAASCSAPPARDLVAPYQDRRVLYPDEPALPGEARPAPAEQSGPLDIRLGQGVLMALENNRALGIQRMDPKIHRTFEEEERAVFDPVLSGQVFGSRSRNAGGAAEGIGPTTGRDAEKSVGGSLGLSERLPTGTEISLEGSTERDILKNLSDRQTTGADFTVTQSLLRGAGLGVNLVGIRQARVDTLSSEYELRGFAETLVAEVETAYWEYALAVRRIAILQESLDLAEQQLRETQQRIRVGQIAETELAAGQAEAALRKEALINARSSMETIRLRLLRLVNPGVLAGRGRDVTLKTDPAVPEAAMDSTESHMELALRMRPEMNQARLGIRRNDLELVKTKNGLLPRMDLFVQLGRTGYADSFARSVDDLDGRRTYQVLVGVDLDYPVLNRAARARHERAMLTKRQAVESLQNLADLVRVDVETACIEVERTREQVAATAATSKLQEEKLRAEAAKFKVGKSTAILVAAAQRDLVSSRVAEIESVVRHLQALVSLFRLDGSLLERRGISAPGRDPVEWDDVGTGE